MLDSPCQRSLEGCLTVPLPRLWEKREPCGLCPASLQLCSHPSPTALGITGLNSTQQNLGAGQREAPGHRATSWAGRRALSFGRASGFQFSMVLAHYVALDQFTGLSLPHCLISESYSSVPRCVIQGLTLTSKVGTQPYDQRTDLCCPSCWHVLEPWLCLDVCALGDFGLRETPRTVEPEAQGTAEEALGRWRESSQTALTPATPK